MRVVRFTLAVLVVCALSTGALRAQEGTYSPDRIDQMVAPIALYPDALTTQILMAATYPNDVADADQWIQANSGLMGSDFDDALASASWDPSVISLCKFPAVLDRMARNYQWTTDLGNAFLNQQDDVLNAIQRFRRTAYQAGYLRTSREQRIVMEGDYIQIEPVSPGVIYVPAYNPAVVYGPAWRFGAFYPTVWASQPGGEFVNGFAWGVGFEVTGVLFGACDWHHHAVYVNNNVIINNRIYRNTDYYQHRDPNEGHSRDHWVHNAEYAHQPADFHRAPYGGESHGAIRGMNHAPAEGPGHYSGATSHAGTGRTRTLSHKRTGRMTTGSHAGTGSTTTLSHRGAGRMTTGSHTGARSTFHIPRAPQRHHHTSPVPHPSPKPKTKSEQ